VCVSLSLSLFLFLSHFLFLLVDGHICRSHSFVVLNSCNRHGIQVSLLYADLHSFGYMPRSGWQGHREVYVYSEDPSH
jgi:tRNA splicing endonuclease